MRSPSITTRNNPRSPQLENEATKTQRSQKEKERKKKKKQTDMHTSALSEVVKSPFPTFVSRVTSWLASWFPQTQ